MSEEALHMQFSVENITKVLAEVDYKKLIPIAVQLGLEGVMSEIEDEPVSEQRRLCLARKWLSKRGEEANWEALASALCHEAVGENKVARHIEDRYMRRGSRTSSVSSGRSSTSSPGPLSPPFYAVRDLGNKEKVSKAMRDKTEKDATASFANLVALVSRKLSQKENFVPEFRSYLTIFFQKQQIAKAIDLPDTTDIFTIITSVSEQKLWNYCNYGDIDGIITNYLREDREVHKAFEDHKDMVDNFLATKRIADHIEVKIVEELRTLQPLASGNIKRNTKGYYTLLSVKLHNVNIGRKTLKYVRDLWKQLRLGFGLRDCNAILDHIYRGCVEITWIIPPYVREDFQRTHPWSAIRFLQEESASRMVLNGTYCIYDKDDSMKLVKLCSEGKHEEVSQLLRSEEKGAAVNATFMEILDDKSALIVASEEGHEFVMFVLLDYEADVNFKMRASGRSALFYAAEYGQDAAITILLAYGADPHLKDKDGETAYSIAKKQSGNEKVLEELEKTGWKKREAVKSISTSQRISERLEDVRVTVLAPFHRAYEQWSADLVGAARNDHLDIVQFIINNNKSDVNARESDRYGWTPLMWASENGNVEMAEFLLKKEADPNLATKGSKWTPLQLASRRGHFKIAKALLDNHADPNTQTIEGLTALSIAAYEHRTAIAMLLIHRGANIHIREYSGWSAFIRACNEGNLKLMKVISDLGAHPNDQTEEGWSALMVASHYNHIDVIRELIRRRAYLDLTTEAGDTALHIASVQNHPDVVNELASHGADLNVINKDGLTPLMVAVNKGYSNVVDVLLEHHPDVNREHADTGWTAIFMAAKNDRVGILKQLLLHGAKPELADGTTLVDVASHLNQMQIIDALGTAVDEGKTPLKADTGYQDIANSLDSLVRSLEERFRGIMKGYQ